MRINTDPQKIEEILTRGVSEAIDKESLRKRLLSGKKLRVKLGIDPTSPNIHIGRSVALLKLKDFQDLGHTVVFIVGDFTGVIGDTSDKDSERPMLSQKEIKKNMASYFKQAGTILDMRSVEKKYNSTWLKKLGYGEIGEQANLFSVSDFIARENIKKRIDEGKRVSLRELLYPLMQGYDSVQVKADIELGGTDQRFNLLAGRRMQEYFGQEPQDILMMDLMEGLDGRKMSSSWGNTINILDTPREMYGKVMSMRDEGMISYFVSCTRIPMAEIDDLRSGLASGKTNPRDVKMQLAKHIVSIYHGDKAAQTAENDFVATFQKKEIPDEMEEIQTKKGGLISGVLVEAKTIASKNEFHRLVREGAVKNLDTGDKITDPTIKINTTTVLKIGKKKFVKIMVS